MEIFEAAVWNRVITETILFICGLQGTHISEGPPLHTVICHSSHASPSKPEESDLQNERLIDSPPLPAAIIFTSSLVEGWHKARLFVWTDGRRGEVPCHTEKGCTTRTGRLWGCLQKEEGTQIRTKTVSTLMWMFLWLKKFSWWQWLASPAGCLGGKAVTPGCSSLQTVTQAGGS